MFYDTNLDNHHLKYNPFKSCVVPRPIAWISSVDKTGIINTGPYSYFNAVADKPPIIMFASAAKPTGGEKDSLTNIQTQGEFVVNICSYEQRIKMNETSTNLPYGTSEVSTFDIEMESSTIVNVPRIKAAKISLECRYLKTEHLQVNNILASSKVVFGHVVGVYIDDSLIEDGKIRVEKLNPIAKLGYDEYTVVEKIFRMVKR